MTNYQHKKGNRIIKIALLNLIADIMKSNATASFTWLDEGYENDKQRIHFTYCGIEQMVVGMWCPDVENGLITLKTKNGLGQVAITANIKDIRIQTLEKIACEVYDTLRDPEKDDEYDIVRDDYVSNFLDTYLR